MKTNCGGRQTFWTYTFKNNAAFIAQSAQIFTQEIEKIKDANGINPSIAYQPITTEMMAQFSKNGGNPLGLAGGQTPLTGMSPMLPTLTHIIAPNFQ